jgi:hypothetical protein
MPRSVQSSARQPERACGRRESPRRGGDFSRAAVRPRPLRFRSNRGSICSSEARSYAASVLNSHMDGLYAAPQAHRRTPDQGPAGALVPSETTRAQGSRTVCCFSAAVSSVGRARPAPSPIMAAAREPQSPPGEGPGGGVGAGYIYTAARALGVVWVQATSTQRRLTVSFSSLEPHSCRRPGCFAAKPH